MCEATHDAHHLFSWLSEVFLFRVSPSDKNYKMKSQLLVTAARQPRGTIRSSWEEEEEETQGTVIAAGFIGKEDSCNYRRGFLSLSC